MALASLPPRMLFPASPAGQRGASSAAPWPRFGPLLWAHTYPPAPPILFPTNPDLRPVSPNQVHSPGSPPGEGPAATTEEGGQEPWSHSPLLPCPHQCTPRIPVTPDLSHPRARVTPPCPLWGWWLQRESAEALPAPEGQGRAGEVTTAVLVLVAMAECGPRAILPGEQPEAGVICPASGVALGEPQDKPSSEGPTEAWW